jgi:hypothetical protein
MRIWPTLTDYRYDGEGFVDSLSCLQHGPGPLYLSDEVKCFVSEECAVYCSAWAFFALVKACKGYASLYAIAPCNCSTHRTGSSVASSDYL